MVELYAWLKAAHVMFAVLAGGASATCGIMMERGARTSHAPHVLRSVRFVLWTLVVPSLVVLPVLGSVLTSLGHWSMSAPWMESAVLGWAGIMVATLASAILLGGQVRRAEGSGVDGIAYLRRDVMLRIIGGAAGLLYLTVIFLMVAKPG